MGVDGELLRRKTRQFHKIRAVTGQRQGDGAAGRPDDEVADRNTARAGGSTERCEHRRNGAAKIRAEDKDDDERGRQAAGRR